MAKPIIAIVAATRAPGRGLINAILDDPAGRFAVRAITLDVNTGPARSLALLGVELVVGHPGTAAALREAFVGAFAAFYCPPFVDPPVPQKEIAEIAAMAEAAKEAGLRHVVWATFGEVKTDVTRVFQSAGVSLTCVHTLGMPPTRRIEAAAEALGRSAYGVLKSDEHIGKVVLLSSDLPTAQREMVSSTPVPAPPPTPTRTAATGAPRVIAPAGTGPFAVPRATAPVGSGPIAAARTPVPTHASSLAVPRPGIPGNSAPGAVPRVLAPGGSAQIVVPRTPVPTQSGPITATAAQAPNPAVPPAPAPLSPLAKPAVPTTTIPTAFMGSRSSRWARPAVIVPALAAFAILGYALLRSSPRLDFAQGSPSMANPATGTSDVPPRTPQVGDSIEKIDPPNETVTSRWDRERAELRGAAHSKKRVDVAVAEPQKNRPKRIEKDERQRAASTPPVSGNPVSKRAQPHREQPVVDTPPPSRPPPATSPRPAAVAAPETPPAPSAEPAMSPAAAVSPGSRGEESPVPAALAPGTIDPKRVNATIRAHAAEVRSCFDRAIMEHSELHGRIAIQATIDPTGHVVSVSPASTIEGGARLQACIVSAFENWTFPPPEGGISGSISYSFSFQ